MVFLPLGLFCFSKFVNFSFTVNFRIFKIRKYADAKLRSLLASRLRDSTTGVIVKRLTADDALVALYGWERRYAM